MKIYLAGPEVFLPDARAVLDAKIALTRAAGFTPLAPGDLDEGPAGETAHEKGLRISATNEEMMAEADAIIANLTPFRGPGADVGTVYELGLMLGMGKRGYGYSNVTASHEERIARHSGPIARDAHGWLRDAAGLGVEEFGMADNLMLPGGLLARGGQFVTHAAAGDALYHDTTAFETCLRLLAETRVAAG